MPSTEPAAPRPATSWESKQPQGLLVPPRPDSTCGDVEAKLAVALALLSQFRPPEFDERIPETQRPGAVAAARAVVNAALDTLPNGVEAELAVVDCSLPPCMFGLVANDGVGQAVELVRTTLTEEFGTGVRVHSSVMRDGASLSWFWPIPETAEPQTITILEGTAADRMEGALGSLRESEAFGYDSMLDVLRD